MSTAQHTPGPWVAVNEGPHWNNPKINMWNVYHGSDKEHVVDQVIECAYSEATAHLIASAPDLLEALQNLMTRVQCDKDAKHWFTDEQKAVRAAIAKAKGVSSE